MDEANLQIFKMKFIKLTLILNVIFLLIGGTVIAYYFLGPDLKLPVSLILAAGAVLLSLYFRHAYRSDKQWLDENR